MDWIQRRDLLHAVSCTDGQLGPMLWMGYLLVAIEGGILWYFEFTCPLTIIARRYSDSARANFDIFLPEWLARYTKLIYTTVVAVIICLTLFHLVKRLPCFERRSYPALSNETAIVEWLPDRRQ